MIIISEENNQATSFLDYNTTGDGILTGANLIKVMVEEKKSLSELCKVIKVFPQVLVNVHVTDKSKCTGSEYIQQIIAENQAFLGETGRILIRPSGTEPFIRVMVEGEKQDVTAKVASTIADAIKRKFC